MNTKNKFITYIPFIGYTLFTLILSQSAALAIDKDIVIPAVVIQEVIAPKVQIKDIPKIDNLDKEKISTIVIKQSLSDQIPSDETKRCPEWESKFKEYGLPVNIFSYIAFRESTCNEKAINAKFDKKGNVTWTLNKDGSIDRGLVQINSCWKSVVKDICGTNLDGLLNVDCNLKVARYILENTKGGLGNWGFK